MDPYYALSIDGFRIYGTNISHRGTTCARGKCRLCRLYEPWVCSQRLPQLFTTTSGDRITAYTLVGLFVIPFYGMTRRRFDCRRFERGVLELLTLQTEYTRTDHDPKTDTNF